MKRFLPKILIPIISLGIFLAPISPIFEKNDEQLAIKTEINKAKAQETKFISIEKEAVRSTYANFSVIITDPNNNYGGRPIVVAIVKKSEINNVTAENATLYTTYEKADQPSDATQVIPIHTDAFPVATYPNLPLEPNTAYYIIVTMYEPSVETTLFVPISINVENVQREALEFTTSTDDNTESIIVGSSTTTTTSEPPPYDLSCTLMEGWDGIAGCVAAFLYHIVWQVSAWVARLAGSFLDFFVYYSTNGDSYTSIFIVKAWGAIRDIANIFFIVALIYIALTTILGLGVANNKKLIGYIVVIALLINFSMFFTQVIIDSSNILAKVFYNQIKPVNENGQELSAGAGGQVSISVGLIKGFNPQAIITNQQDYLNNRGMFIFITLLLIAITLYTAYMFFIVAILFVGRVVSLWISMIFSPLAFASYTVPFDIPGFGHKKWWDDLLKACFLAPIFIFFLYIIVLFADLTKDAVYYASTSTDFMQHLMKTIIPFAIIIILLMKAKELAVQFSGDLGKALSKVGGMALGLAGGAVMGGAALLGSGVVGGLASRVTGSEGLKNAAEKKGLLGFASRMALRTADFGTKATFDLRKTAAGGALAKGMGANFQSASILGLGSKAGGFKGIQERGVRKAQEESELFKTKMTNAEVEAKYAKKAYDYDSKMNEERLKAKETLKENFNEDTFKANYAKNHGPRPEEYTTSDQLNNARMKTFAENIGKTGLVYSAAHTLVNQAAPVSEKDAKEATDKYNKEKMQAQIDAEKKQGIKFTNADGKLNDAGKLFNKAYEKEHGNVPTMESMMENRVKYVKMGIAAAATVGTGGYFGGVAGATLGGTILAGEAFKESATTRATQGAFTKQTAQMENVQKRITEMEKILEKQTDILKDSKDLEIEMDGVKQTMFDKDGNVDSKKVKSALNEMTVQGEALSNKMKSITDNVEKQKSIINTMGIGSSEGRRAKDELLRLEGVDGKGGEIGKILKDKIDVVKKTATLNELKDIKEKIENTETQIFNLKGKKGDMSKTSTSSTSSGSTTSSETK
ncbi:MAG: hypothetical protein WA101_00550 [Minisyncoccia bacterium]